MKNSLLEPNNDILERITYDVLTDVGIQREQNQDSYTIINGENFVLYVICDGMGGMQGGEIASQLAVSHLKKTLEGEKLSNNTDRLVECVKQANDIVYEYGVAHPEVRGLGTTITALLVTRHGSWFINVGDSRIYKIEKDSLLQLTTDNTVLNELLKQGAVPKEDIEAHPVSYMLTKTIGQGEGLEVDFGRIGFLNEGDEFILCSDGLYNMVSNEDIVKIVRENDEENIVEELIKEANKQGGSDNITVIYVKVKKEKGAQDLKEERKKKEQKAKEAVENKRDEKKLLNKIKIDNFKNIVNEAQIEPEEIKGKKKSDDKKSLIQKLILATIIFFLVMTVFLIINNKNEEFSDDSKSENNLISENEIISKKFEFDNSILKMDINLNKEKKENKELLLKEKEAYEDVLNIALNNEVIDKESLDLELNKIEKNKNEFEMYLEGIKNKINSYQDYDGQDVVKVGREIKGQDEKVRKIFDDYIQYSISIADNQNESTNVIRREKLDDLQNAINTYMKESVKKNIKSLSDNVKENELDQIKKQSLKLKKELLKIQENNDEEGLKTFISKIKSFIKRFNLKINE